MSRYVLTLTCPDRVGVVRDVASFVSAHGCSIDENHQFVDPVHDRLFMRVSFLAVGDDPGLAALQADLAPIAVRLEMACDLYDVTRPPRLLVMVSRHDHCLHDLLYRQQTAGLSGEIVLVVSNHDDLRGMVEAQGVTYLHVPVTPETKRDAEQRLLALVDEHDIDLVVLARYMQVLSPAACERLPGRIINIHHSFLPGFAGAKPYVQAFERGVKLVGATAHYVTAELDAGPIIEQEVRRVDHRETPDDLARTGRQAEREALARAVDWHCQRRVLLNGSRTIVFS
jgi:formyltetrahydrofolate deformylase